MQKVVSGESGSVPEERCTEWKTTTLPSILAEYNPHDVFNMDETGLFFKCLPNKTLAFKNDKCFGGKHSKERVTVVFCCNVTGSEKLRPMVIGKSKRPRCFKNVKSLEVDYYANKKAWMTGEIFEEWISNFDKKMKKEKRNVLLFVDNCPAHPPDIKKKLQNVKLMFFPPNATSKLQPLDQGNIKNAKVYYRKQLLKKIICLIEKKEPIENVIDLRGAIATIAKVWENDVKESTIKNCFVKCGYEFRTELSEDEESDVDSPTNIEACWDALQSVGVLDGGISLDEYLCVDDDVVVAEYPTDQEILDSVLATRCETVEADEEENDVEVEEVSKPSKAEMVAAFETIRRGIQSIENVPHEIFSSLNKCEHFYERQKEENKVQQDIRNYCTPFN